MKPTDMSPTTMKVSPRPRSGSGTLLYLSFSRIAASETMASAAGQQVAALRVDGGASVMPLLLQFQADQLGVPVSRPKITETTALGSGFLAGMAEGVWDSPGDVASAWQLDAEATPNEDRTQADRLYADWIRAVERSRGWATE